MVKNKRTIIPEAMTFIILFYGLAIKKIRGSRKLIRFLGKIHGWAS